VPGIYRDDRKEKIDFLDRPAPATVRPLTVS
ncbi:uncharacterized protein METZ01_LOCUS410700, partial [marine metagenome]